MLAGAFAYRQDVAIPTKNLDRFRQFFDELDQERGSVRRHESKRFELFHWDSGAYADSAWISSPDSICALVGDPLLESQGKPLTRCSQLQRLLHRSGAFDAGALTTARGNFVALSFDTQNAILRIVTDQLGLRPIYCISQDGVVYFSSALHLLESLPQLSRTLDRKGLAEYLAFGFSLADRTPYREIALLPEATLLRVDALGPSQSQYFDWDGIRVDRTDLEEAARNLFSTFEDAVRLRCAGSVANAFLSGGMDSRAIVAALVAQGCHVRAFNFSPDASQDQAFAVAYAKMLATRCTLSLRQRPRDFNFSVLAAQALQSSLMSSDDASQRQIWSGDGGSVCLGYVYLDESMLQLAEARAWTSAARVFLERNRFYIAPPLLAPEWRATANQELEDSVADAMQRYDNGDAGRNLYFFLLFNDQRRHLYKHFESIHQHGLEFHLPFFDTLLVKEIVRTPTNWGLRHHLYGRWFSHFSASTRATPWQTYPGHEACPIASDDALSYQWSQKAGHETKLSWERRYAGAAALLQLARHPPAHHLIDRLTSCKAATAHLLGLRNLQHLVDSARRWSALRPSRSF